MAKESFQTVTMRPLLGALDMRSSPEDVLPGVWRYKQNFRMTGGTRLCTRPGHEKLFSSKTPYTNYDYHDQGSIIDGTPTRELPTMLFQGQKNDGSHYLYVASDSRIAWLNETNGLWNTVGNALNNAPGSRFKAAELQEFIIFTNNIGAPVYTQAATPTVVDVVPGLQGLNLTAAGVVVQFQGFILVMDVVQGGLRISSRIWWSDFNLPLNWGIVSGSLSNFQDLDYGSQILAAVPMAGNLYIFTTTAIWRMNVTGSDTVFGFTKVYSEPLNQAKCLVYPNTLVSNGNSCWYVSQEAIYYYDPYIPEPERVEWLYRGSTVLFDENSALSPLCCQAPSAVVKPEDQEVYISFPLKSANPEGTCVNSQTLVFNYKYQSVDIVDRGYGAFVNYIPSNPDDANCKTLSQIFAGSDVLDYCLKNIGVNFSLEQCTNFDNHGAVEEGEFVPFTATYAFVGYYNILRMMLPLQNFDRNKILNNVLLENHVAPGVANNIFRLRVGYSFGEADPNLPDEKCAVLWRPTEDRPVACRDTLTPSQYVAQNLIRNEGTEWTYFVEGRFLYIEIKIAAADGSPAIGADCCLSRIETKIFLKPRPL